MKSFSIKKWAEDDRPREKLLNKGSSTLSNAELLAIIIGSGNSKDSAVHLMQKIMASTHDDLGELYKLSFEKLIQWNGIGEAKAVKIKAVLELGKRFSHSAPKRNTKCTTSKDAYTYIKQTFNHIMHEEVWLVCLNTQNEIFSKDCISKGGLNSSSFDLKILLKRALERMAVGIILIHNHPANSLQPSDEDKIATQKIKSATQQVDIHFLDHLIIGNSSYFSFADASLL